MPRTVSRNVSGKATTEEHASVAGVGLPGDLAVERKLAPGGGGFLFSALAARSPWEEDRLRRARERIRRLALKLDLRPPLTISDLIDELANELALAESARDWTGIVGAGLALRSLATQIRRGAMGEGVPEKSLQRIRAFLRASPRRFSPRP